jgi:hypothetical protein
MELIISLISLALSTVCSILTIIVNLKVSKLNNLEALHKYEKQITKFELSFKDEAWLVDVVQSGEFNNYDEESKKLIHQWWLEYKKEHEPKKAKSTLPKSKNFSGARYKLARPIQSSRNRNNRMP